MAELSRYHGLELPEFPPELILKNDIRNIATVPPPTTHSTSHSSESPETSVQSDFYRTLRIFKIETAPLRTILDTARVEFATATDTLRQHGIPAKVVEHTFGLFRIDDATLSDVQDYLDFRSLVYKHHPSIPSGYGLAAKTEIIYGEPVKRYDFADYDLLNIALNAYKLTARKSGRKHWTDAHPRQYMSCRLPNNKAFTLVDIEPILGSV